MAIRGIVADIAHRPGVSGGRFELNVDGKQAAFLDYSLSDAATLCIDYVEVSPALRGRQLGNQLVDAAVAWARSRDWRVTATCSFARAVLARRSHG
jgi:predicted GNAT family acetyltransferase